MPTKAIRRHNGKYADMLKTIRPFVDFDYSLNEKLTSGQKSKIARYAKHIDELQARPHHAYRFRNKQHRKAAQDFAQHGPGFPGLKVALVPTDGDEKEPPKLRFTKGGVELVKRNLTMQTLQFNKKRLAQNPKAETRRILKNDTRSERFAIQAGKYELKNTYGRQQVIRKVAQLANQYSDRDKNNYFGNWLNGLIGYRFTNQADLKDYRQTKADAREKLARDRKNARRRSKRALLKGRQ